MASYEEKGKPMTITHQDSEVTITEIKGTSSTDIEQLAPNQIEEPDFVDGSVRGWVIVFAGFFAHMISMGFGNVYGVYQNYYLNNTFQDRASSFQLAWIGSLTMMTLDVTGPFTGAICVHFGFRQSGFVGVLIMTMSLVAAAYATEVWQLYLTQGILYGLGAGLTYFASLSLPSQWFRRNRGLATGITISGGGIGGLWLSPLLSKLLERKGLRWTMLCCAIAHIVLLTPAVFLFKGRLETGRQRAKRIAQFGYRKGESKEGEKKRKFVDFTILKDVRFCLLFVAGIFVVSGYFTPFYYINSYAVQHGVDASSAALMVGLMNGSSAIGRIVMGFVSDRIGSINALLISTFAASLTILLIWTFAKTAAVMFVFSILYGLCCGAYLSSTVSVTAAICGLERLAVVTGIIYAGMAVGSVSGSPISGAILDSVGHKTDYTGVIFFSGGVMSVGTVILFFLKFKTSRNMFAKV
ncbi:hypothetical protein BGZ52_007041 [Haplosporangium bisporale]|nr:hypothetical protein BGZ52_007041 [Haplosporangium bisporale]